jgi:E3 ubiquitin-protein ligase CCNP1IP1
MVVESLLTWPDMQVDQDTLRRRNEELTQAFREKSRKQMQTQELYDKLKRRSMLGQVQEAASDAVDHTVQASAIGSRFIDRVTNQNLNQHQHQRQRSPPPQLLYSEQSSIAMQRPGGLGVGNNNMAPPASQPRRGDTAWAGFSNQGSNLRMKTESMFLCVLTIS